MAGYLEKLTADMKAAMKAREQDKLTVLRMIISDIKKKAEAEGELSDEAELAILQKAVKTRSDTIDQAKAAGRDEIAAREQLEIEMIEGYLPAQMSAELFRIVRCSASAAAFGAKVTSRTRQTREKDAMLFGAGGAQASIAWKRTLTRTPTFGRSSRPSAMDISRAMTMHGV